MRVKICGTRNLEEAQMIVASGADALGFLVGLLEVNPDQITAEQAAEIVAQLPSSVTPVLVTQQADPLVVADLCRRAGTTAVQLHGGFAPHQIPLLRRQLPSLTVIQVVHVTEPEARAAAQHAAEFADVVLLDSPRHGRAGGTGRTHDWSLSRKIARACPKPVILAGGLTPENVELAIRTVHPSGVDVHSGVEDGKGNKSKEKLLQFVARARQALEFTQ
jgi:phosphoribosylanthranilate isomerase